MKGAKKHTALHEWQQRCKRGTEKCRKCGETRFLTVDHVIPVMVLDQMCLEKYDFNYNFEENFEILCKYCNSEKGHRLDPRNPKTYSLLRKLIDQSEREAFQRTTRPQGV